MTKSSRHNEWWTKQSLYLYLCTKYHIAPLLDVAANADNTKCPFWMRHSLEIDWLVKNAYDSIDNVKKYDMNIIHDIWLNPPLVGGACKLFTLKALEQWRKFGMNILMILPAGVIARQYFQPIWQNFREGTFVDIDPIIPRPKFLEYGKETKWQARNDYISVLLRKHK